MKAFSTSLGVDAGGTYLEVYTDSDGASGYGDKPMVGRWYGSMEACKEIARTPWKVKLSRLVAGDSPDPFDLACERRFD